MEIISLLCYRIGTRTKYFYFPYPVQFEILYMTFLLGQDN